MEGCISDNWMRGSNSYLKRTRLVALSKKVTITISPNQPLCPSWKCQCESASIDGSLCLISSQRWDFPWAKTHKGLLFFLCTGSLLAAHRQYPLIKPVTPSLTVTLKNQTKVTLCSKSKRSTSTMFIYFPLNRRPFSLTDSSFYLSGGKLQPNESSRKPSLGFTSGELELNTGSGTERPLRGASRRSSSAPHFYAL